MTTKGGKFIFDNYKKYYFLIVPLIIILDQITKYLISLNFELGKSFFLIKDFFSITLIHNYGAGFGILQNQKFLLIGVTLLVLVAIIYYIKREYNNLTIFSYLGLLCIISGAIGNFIDRIIYGFVVDFIYFSFWPAFNIADISISIGVCLLIIDLVLHSKSKKKKN
jgi:signal peptidase II